MRTVIVKGSDVTLYSADGRVLKLPRSYGVIHDPEGQLLERHEIYFCPYILQAKPAPTSSWMRRYFGNRYGTERAFVDVPAGKWKHVRDVFRIEYSRPARERFDAGAIHEGDYFHEFRFPQPLFKATGGFCMVLPRNCVVNERGFVYP